MYMCIYLVLLSFQAFPGNADTFVEETHLFPNPMTWRIVRIELTDWIDNDQPSLRFEVIGCMEPISGKCNDII